MNKIKQKFNVLLIASHHGFFLTLKTVEALKKNIDKLVVIIPEEKIEKYSQMDEEMFQNFQSLVSRETKMVKKSAKVYTAKFDVFRRLSQTAEFLREIKASGIWIQVCAGSILTHLPKEQVLSEMSNTFLMMSSKRGYEEIKQLNMYPMLGQLTLPSYEQQNTDSFIINADHIPEMILPDIYMIKQAMQENMFRKSNPHTFSNEEELVTLAFAGKQLIDHAEKAVKCLIADYWQVVMAPKVPIDKLYAYPLELYLPFVEKCHGLIPDITLERIKKHATECRDYPLAFREALS